MTIEDLGVLVHRSRYLGFKYLAAGIWVFAVVALSTGRGSAANSIDETALVPEGQAANGCVTCHLNNGDEARLYAQSVHAGAKISCTRCHGGDASASDQKTAHSGSFSGKPEPGKSIAMCGSCHTAEFSRFKASKHFPEKKNVARLDCTQCHGTHAIGSAERNFSYAYFCSGCHGLEYLPELNRPFREMLLAADAQNDAINALRKSGKSPTPEQLTIRRETRKLIGDIVHGTDYQGGQEKIPQILKLNDEFKKKF